MFFVLLTLLEETTEHMRLPISTGISPPPWWPCFCHSQLLLQDLFIRRRATSSNGSLCQLATSPWSSVSHLNSYSKTKTLSSHLRKYVWSSYLRKITKNIRIVVSPAKLHNEKLHYLFSVFAPAFPSGSQNVSADISCRQRFAHSHLTSHLGI